MMKHYSVKQLANLAGVSVRTLHLYDEMGLLKPSVRTQKNYRLYGKAEALRLQQILFYRQLGLALKVIAAILDDPAFDPVIALEHHRASLLAKKQQLSALLQTIDKTIDHLKNKTMLSIEDLYEGLPQEHSATRDEALKKWGDDLERSEMHLRKKSKDEFHALKQALLQNGKRLQTLMHHNMHNSEVQSAIREHYELIREFWGTPGSPDKGLDKYIGLADLYLADERYVTVDNKPNRPLAEFMNKAMRHFAKELKKNEN